MIPSFTEFYLVLPSFRFDSYFLEDDTEFYRVFDLVLIFFLEGDSRFGTRPALKSPSSTEFFFFFTEFFSFLFLFFSF